MVHKKSVTRDLSLFDVKAWHIGESIELKKWLDFGFFNHLFHSKDQQVVLYYDIKEANNFEKALDEKLTEEFFDKLCDDFYKLIETPAETEKEVFDLTVKMWPAMCIFHEISNSPDWATETMLKRLIRVRTSTESFSYKIAEKINHLKYPQDYIFFKGNLINKPFDEFIKQKGIVIEN